MRLRLNRSELLETLNRMAPVAKGNKGSIPVLECVLISCDGEDLQISATDLAVTMLEKIEGAVEIPGSAIAVRHALLQKAVASLDAEDLAITISDDTIVLPGMKIRFQAGDAENFPALPEWEPSEVVAVDAALTVAAIDRASTFADRDSTRYSYSVVCVKLENGSAEVLSTDGKRLWSELLKTSDGAMTFCLPLFAIKPLESVCSGDVLRFGLNSERKGFIYAWASDQRRLILREWEGTFPEVSRVLRNPPKESASINSGAFLSAVRRSLVISSEFLLLSSGGLVSIRSRSDFGECSADIDGEGDLDADIQLPTQQVLDAIEALGGTGEEPLALAQGKESQATFWSCQEFSDRLAVIMPMAKRGRQEPQKENQ